MNYSKFFRTALMSLVTVFAFGFGLTSCDPDDNKNPEELILGTWTLNAGETYFDDALVTTVNFDTRVIGYYDGGQLVETDTIKDPTLSITFTVNDDKTCDMTQYDEDGAERVSYTYSIETVGDEKRLVLTADGETEYAVIGTLTKKDLVLTSTTKEEDGTYKEVMHFKK